MITNVANRAAQKEANRRARPYLLQLYARLLGMADVERAAARRFNNGCLVVCVLCVAFLALGVRGCTKAADGYRKNATPHVAGYDGRRDSDSVAPAGYVRMLGHVGPGVGVYFYQPGWSDRPELNCTVVGFTKNHKLEVVFPSGRREKWTREQRLKMDRSGCWWVKAG